MFVKNPGYTKNTTPLEENLLHTVFGRINVLQGSLFIKLRWSYFAENSAGWPHSVRGASCLSGGEPGKLKLELERRNGEGGGGGGKREVRGEVPLYAIPGGHYSYLFHGQ